MDNPKERKWEAENLREKRQKSLQVDSAKCAEFTDMFDPTSYTAGPEEEAELVIQGGGSGERRGTGKSLRKRSDCQPGKSRKHEEKKEKKLEMITRPVLFSQS